MSTPKVLFGFHAVGVRLKTAPKSIVEIYADPTR
ncbi:MAG: 23S rRNA (guanosine(2251)-2'-O)-methyltransferase RlmB, partial [Rhodoferax sp.]